VNKQFEICGDIFYVVMAERACCEEEWLPKGWDLIDNHLHKEALKLA
jgi:hypothetical protein